MHVLKMGYRSTRPNHTHTHPSTKRNTDTYLPTFKSHIHTHVNNTQSMPPEARAMIARLRQGVAERWVGGRVWMVVHLSYQYIHNDEWPFIHYHTNHTNIYILIQIHNLYIFKQIHKKKQQRGQGRAPAGARARATTTTTAAAAARAGGRGGGGGGDGGGKAAVAAAA